MGNLSGGNQQKVSVAKWLAEGVDISTVGGLKSTPIEMIHLQIPTPLNPLGVKGLGEGGAVGAHAAVANAVADALHTLGIAVRATPLSPGQIGAQLAALPRPASRDRN